MVFANILYTIILYPLVQIIEISFKIFDILFNNTGISVLGVSLTVTLLCLPLYIVAEKWQQIERDTQAKLRPGITRIKNTFKGDEQYMILSTFYKQNHYHPMMALRSSFGLLIQIPFFMAAYSCLSKMPALQGKAFLFIRDMGQQDAFFRIGTFPVNILPIAMTLINVIAGAIYTKGFAIKEKLQIYGMALIFLVLLYTSPAGLVLYWTMNNIFSLVKNIFYKLKHPVKVLYLCALVCSLAGAFFVLFIFKTKLANKLIGLIFFLLIIAIPLYVKFFSKLLNGRLSFFVNNSKERNSIFFISCFLLFIITAISVPSSLIGSSPSEFCGIGSNTTTSFIFKNIIFQAFGIFFFWTTCIYFLFGKRIKTLLAFFMSFLALTALADLFIFQGNYGDISQTLVFLNETDFASFGIKSIINLFVIILLFILLALFSDLKKGKVLFYTLTLLSFALIISSIPDFITIKKEIKNYLANSNNQNVSNIKPIFKLSKNHKNLVLLFLDRAQARFIPELFKEAPELYESFSGFVNYPQVLSFNGHTLMGAPAMFGGYEYTPWEMNKRKNETLKDKHNEALLLLPRVFTEELGYSAVITDPSWANYNTFIDTSIADNYPDIQAYKTIGLYNDLWYKANPASDISKNAEILIKRNMLYFAFFRQAPICMRDFIYQHGSYWSTDSNLNDLSTLIDNFAPLSFLKELTSISDTESGSYSCLVNELTHSSYFLQAPEYLPSNNVSNFGSSSFSKNSAYHTQIAAFKMLGKWLDYLKENDIYDNTRIVIVSDHGCDKTEADFEKDAELDKKVAGSKYSGRGHYHCLLMFKDFNSNGKMITDNSFMTNADTVSLLLKDFDKTFTNPFTNKTIPLDTASFKENGIYLTSSDAHKPVYNDTYLFSIKDNEWWHVKENIFESKNWTQEVPHD